MKYIVVKRKYNSGTPIKEACGPIGPKEIYKVTVAKTGQVVINDAPSAENISGDTYIVQAGDKKLLLLQDEAITQHIPLPQIIAALEELNMI